MTITTTPSAINPTVAVRDLKAEVAREAALPGTFDWAKWVDKIDMDQSNTYAFPGNFIDSGTTQVKLGRARVILACAHAGSRKYPVNQYRFLVLAADGTLTATDIQDTNDKRGWALRVRDRVQGLLDSLAGATPASAPATPTAPTTATAVASGPAHGDHVARLLADVLTQAGTDGLSQPKRLIARLSDACANEYHLEQRLLTMAVQEGVLTATDNGIPASLAAEHITARMVNGWGTQTDLARWAATTWLAVTARQSA